MASKCQESSKCSSWRHCKVKAETVFKDEQIQKKSTKGVDFFHESDLVSFDIAISILHGKYIVLTKNV
jgi:hypothetical protein